MTDDLKRLLDDLDGLAHTLAAADALVGEHLESPIHEAELMELASISHRAWLTLDKLISPGEALVTGDPSSTSQMRELLIQAAADAAQHEHQEWARWLRSRLENDEKRNDR